MATSLMRYETLLRCVRKLLGDLANDQWDAEVLYYCVNSALARYSQINERVETQCIQLLSDGLFGQSLLNWQGDSICEVVYLHWPAESTVAATTGENKIVDWWYYNHGHYSSGAKETVYVDLQIEGSPLPAADDYILVSGVMNHRITGMEYTNFDDGTAATYSTIPKTHDYIIALGAASYALKSREVGLAVEASTEPGYISAYHVGVMAEMAARYEQDFEQELFKLSQKKLHRPSWGVPERRRLQRELVK
jgi:hypothetical protein